MSSSVTLETSFALALAARVESGDAAGLDAPGGDIVASKLDKANLLATLDPTRAAFASALQRIDVANAPEVTGPYSPRAASGPLTEDDIFDPSTLYSLPSRELVVVEPLAGQETVSTRSALALASEKMVPFDAGAPSRAEVRPSTLTLELVIADYMSLRQAGLSPTKRKILRGPKSYAAPFFDDRGGASADDADEEDAERHAR